MPVLLLSLHALHQGRPIPEPADTAPREPVPTPVAVPPAEPEVESTGAVSRLGFSQHEVESLVQQAGPDAGRLLLSLICRVASVESELAELRQQLGRVPAFVPQPGPALRQVGPANNSGEGRSALLEKVFQNNMMLWKLIEGDL